MTKLPTERWVARPYTLLPAWGTYGTFLTMV